MDDQLHDRPNLKAGQNVDKLTDSLASSQKMKFPQMSDFIRICSIEVTIMTAPVSDKWGI